MSDILIKGMEMPKDAPVIIKICPDGSVSRVHDGVVATAIPAADVRGKWEYSFYDEDGLEICECVCSSCHNYKESYAKWIYDDGQRNWFNFCPNCGVDMREESRCMTNL